ncbi:MAG: class I SAM-dependent methyltransferase [Bdellovibrionales bacterium]|nr:class I SAM-dependent methyltransferase [Bdellovibrionales bacterium]
MKVAIPISEAYDSEPWWYDLRGLFILTFSYRTTLWDQLQFFSKNIRFRHLEAAVGSGSLFAILLRWVKLSRPLPAKIWAFDYAEPMLVGARARFKAWPNVTVFAADAARLDLPSSSVESVNLANAFHCIANIEGALTEFHRVLIPQGTFATNVLLFPRGLKPWRWLASRINRWGMHKGILHTPYEEQRALTLVEASGFELLEHRVRGNSLNILARKA